MTEWCDLASVLEDRAANMPHRPFFTITGGVKRSFSEFNEEANRVAHGLADAGVRAGDCVAIMLRNSVEFLTASFALKKLRAVEVAVNTNLRGQGLKHALTVAPPRFLITECAHGSSLVEADVDTSGIMGIAVIDDCEPVRCALPSANVDHFTRLLGDRADNPAPQGHPTDLAAIVYTSGTTGASKGCMLSHRYGLVMGANFARALGVRPADCVYCPFPMYHVDAPYLTVAPALIMGARAAIGVRFSVSGFWDEIRALDVTIFDYMGATLTMLWKQEERGDDSDNPARLGWGVPLPAFRREFERRFGVKLVTAYGLTDGGMVAYGDPGGDERDRSCGRVVPPYELRIADPFGDELPRGRVGEILLRSSLPGAMMSGYIGMPAATNEAFKHLWLNTGDLGRLDDDGYLYFEGRTKDSIRRRGENISAWEIEQVIESHPSVAEAAAVGVPSALSEEDVKVFVVLRVGHTLEAEELRAFCRPRMARYMLPEFVQFIDAIPHTPTGKAAKHLLPRAEIAEAG